MNTATPTKIKIKKTLIPNETAIHEILQQRGKEYGSFKDNTNFAMNFYYAKALHIIP